MKKFAKGCFITALSMLIIGTIILAICTFIGGTTLFTYAKNEMRANVDIDSLLDNSVISWHRGETHIDFSDEHPTHSGQHEDLQVALGSDISNLNMEIGAGGCIVSESSDEYFHIYAKNAPEFQYYTENHTLYIKGFDNVPLNIHHNDHNYIYLEIPKDFSFENIDLEIGAGIVEADSFLASNSISMEIGAGELTVDSLSADMLCVELGAGNAELEHASVNNSNIQIGLGNMTYSGSITGNLSAECGLGNLDLYLNDTLENHNYSINCSIGNITLNHNSYSGIAHTEEIHHDADSTYTLECGMGNMNVQFE